MERAALAKRLREIREARLPAISRREVGEQLGYRGESAYQLVYEWETDRRGIPAESIPELADLFGVTICDLYGFPEGHQAATTTTPMTRLAQDLASALAVPADKIEIHVYAAGEWQIGQSVEGGEFQPTRADRGTRLVLERWETMTEEQRERLLAFADEIRRNKGETE